MRNGEGKRGRPSLLLDPTRKGAILDSIRAGASLRAAAQAAGVGYSTLKGWQAQGQKDQRAGRDTELSAFLAQSKKASAEFVVTAVAAIQAHGKTCWQASAWLLERRCPEHFGRRRAEVRRLARQVDELLRLLRDAGLTKPGPPPA